MQGATRIKALRGIGLAAVFAAVSVCVTTGAAAKGLPAEVKRESAPDLILYNGRISTVDADNSTAEAIAIRDGVIIATGGNGPVKALAKKGTRLIHLQGRRVLPGLIDGHIHGMRNAYHCFTQTVRLDLVTSRAKALAAYAAKAASLPGGRWIWTTSGGWNLNQLDVPVVFTFAELSAAAPNNPLWIQGSGIVGARVNQAALTALGLSAGSPGVVLDSAGQPTGQLSSPASTLANQAIVAHLDGKTLEERAACLADFMHEVNRRGMTAWKDAGGNQAPWGGNGEIGDRFNVREPTQYLHRSGGFTVRIAYHDMSNYAGYQQVLLDTRTRVGPLGDDTFRYMGPGEDTMPTDVDYPDFTRYSAFKRLSVETHVGNLDSILNGFEVANSEVYPISRLTWSIAHPNNGQPTDSQLDRAAALKIGFSLTFSSVRNGGAGPRFRSTMQRENVRMCLATDAMNVAPYAPFQSLWYVTTGQTMLPGVQGVPPEERLTRTQALRHATVECAWNLAQEGRLGSLEAGKYADLIVLSDDYFSVPDAAIKDLTSVLTVVGGRIVYDAGVLKGKKDDKHDKDD